jgi:hypothetical protein
MSMDRDRLTTGGFFVSSESFNLAIQHRSQIRHNASIGSVECLSVVAEGTSNLSNHFKL